MKNIRIKSLVALTLILTIFSVITWVENAKTTDILASKNLSHHRIRVNKIINIQEIEERKIECEKYLNNWDKNYIEEQDQRADIFILLSFMTFLSLGCTVVSLVELKKNKNVS